MSSIPRTAHSLTANMDARLGAGMAYGAAMGDAQMNLCAEHQIEAPRRVKSLCTYAHTDPSEFDRLWKQTLPDLRAEKAA